MDKDEALKNYIEGMGTSKNKHYIRFVERFLHFAVDLDRDNYLRYREKLKNDGYGKTTIKLQEGTIRALYQRNGIKWPLKRGENTQINAGDERAIALTKPTVQLLIDSAKAGKFNILDTLLLAVSTTYGLRPIEMPSSVRTIELNNRTMYVYTAKHGRERYHHIPEEIVPVIEQAAPNVHHISRRYVTDAFTRMETICEIKHVEGTGFHSIRRSLNYFLNAAGVNGIDITKFLRWGAGRDTKDMATRYTQVMFSGVDVEDGLAIGNDKEEDMKIFEVHPLLPMWR